MARGGAALLLAVLLAAPASEAQPQPPRPWNRDAGPGGVLAVPSTPPPVVRSAPQLPHYYLERRAPSAQGPVGPNEVAASVRARGFRDIAPVQQRGNTLIIPQATGPSGERVQLVIGPSGEIVGVRVLGGAR
jgi:hypothetical protein